MVSSFFSTKLLKYFLSFPWKISLKAFSVLGALSRPGCCVNRHLLKERGPNGKFEKEQHRLVIVTEVTGENKYNNIICVLQTEHNRNSSL